MAFFKDNRISNHLTHDENEDVDMLAADEFGSGKLYNEGDPIYECQYCGAYFWYAERIDKKCKKKTCFHFVLWSLKDKASQSKGSSYYVVGIIIWIR
ncbi:hypothetical protein KY284_035969 [Solanum tuberosum]|nr:hypothetical protein KY284_035969 [Solanum tuberosum]